MPWLVHSVGFLAVARDQGCIAAVEIPAVAAAVADDLLPTFAEPIAPAAVALLVDVGPFALPYSGPVPAARHFVGVQHPAEPASPDLVAAFVAEAAVALACVVAGLDSNLLDFAAVAALRVGLVVHTGTAA